MKTHESPSMAIRPHLPPGEIVSFGEAEIPLFVRVPHAPPRGVLVAVHGNTRQGAVHALRFAPLAAAHDLLLVAPSFSRDVHPRFRRLENGADEQLTRSIVALLDALGLGDDRACAKWLWFGHSAGAQFVHRYVYRNPQRVQRAALSAAGWYTLPDAGVHYPYGLGAPTASGRAARAASSFSQVDLRAALAVPQRVFVGDQDVRSGDALRREAMLDGQQGTDRLARARTFVAAMRASARQHGLAPAVSLRELPGAGHDFDTNMRRTRLGRLALRFLLAGMPHQHPLSQHVHEEIDDVEQAPGTPPDHGPAHGAVCSPGRGIGIACMG